MDLAIKENLYTFEDYYNTPENDYLELINGKFYNMAAPSTIHQRVSMELSTTIHSYIKSKNGKCEVFPAPFNVKLSRYTVVEPDISVICDKNKLDKRGCNGSPDFIIEIISPSTQSLDFVKKLNLYCEYGVREYWIVNPLNRKILVYYFKKGFMPITYTFEDTIKVNIYDDLYICLKDIV